MYKWTDENGKIYFSNTVPPSSAKVVNTGKETQISRSDQVRRSTEIKMELNREHERKLEKKRQARAAARERAGARSYSSKTTTRQEIPRPKLITAKTDPNMGWQQAAMINKQRIDDYNARTTGPKMAYPWSVINAMNQTGGATVQGNSHPNSIINPYNGRRFNRAAGGYIDPHTGTFYTDAAGGIINIKTGKFIPTN